jgi:DivIVA domain-containing protein
VEKKIISLHLDSKQILEKHFLAASPGYNALHVDEFLDVIIRDYQAVESNCLYQKKYVDELQNEIMTLKKTVEQLEIENKSLKTKISGIGDISKANSTNIEMLKRINALEKTLWKLGVNPTNIK